MKRAARGLTLIELLVAIAIFAILGVMSWRALSTTLDSRDALKRDFSEWQGLTRALSRVESDLSQIAVREIINSESLPALKYTVLEDGSNRLVFWRMLDTVGTRLTGFEFRQGNFELLRWKTDDYTLEPRREVLIPNVKAVRWTFTDAQAATPWLPKWPLQAERVGDLPAGLRLELDIDGIGTVRRTYALR